IIKTFKKQPDKKEDDGRITKNGKAYYCFAKPIKVDAEKCLRCHGDPVNAPAEQKTIYGTEHGYNWKLGDIASAYIVYVPLQKAFDLAKKEAVKLVLIGAVIVALMMTLLWFFFNLYIIDPITMLEKRATEISLGKNLSETISTSSDDEIGSLARSVDRLRISVEKMLQRFKK
ncbi:MAG: methyl-accepting chemotaxis protein, partial [Thermodesulfobacteriota bacterium]|nr:methyl-accepting chemotaxis protein [Thermodesulfobacteriota bacterium]